MTVIEIEKNDHWCYNFYLDKADPDIWKSAQKCCNYCGGEINKVYSYIINNLREANLLVEDYKLICCYCQVLQKFGLLELKEYLSMITYSEPKDILAISFLSTKKEILKDPGWLTGYVFFFIHDYSKIAEVY